MTKHAFQARAAARHMVWVALMVAALGGMVSLAQAACDPETADGLAVIERVQSSSGEGQGYRMAYCVDVPLEAYWHFKTDFHNEFLVENPHIVSHRFLHQQGNAVVTENRYAGHTQHLFRWQTHVHPEDHRLEFHLLNPVQAGQDFHYGTIRLEARGQHTMVYQEAFFQFRGAALWARYPWHGGMRSFLQANIQWERQAALARTSHYDSKSPQNPTDRRLPREVFTGNPRYPDK